MTAEEQATAQLNDMLDQLREARNTAADAREIKRKMTEELQAGVAYAAADDMQQKADEAATELDAAIRRAALELYDSGVEVERVTVKWFTTVTKYDEYKAKEWAMHNMTPALTLDKKKFEAAVKDGNVPAELATTEKEARAQIATKL